MEEFIKEMDEAQEGCYEDFLEALELDDTTPVWDAFVAVWSAGKSWGEQMEYSYPS